MPRQDRVHREPELVGEAAVEQRLRETTVAEDGDVMKTSRRAEGIGGGRDSSPADDGSSSGRDPSRNERSRTWQT
jgi:hypothetical protein